MAGGESQRMSPERYFLMYAFPCVRNLLHEDKISKKDASTLESVLFENRKIERTYMEFCFPNAFRRIKIIANEMNKDYWNIDVLKKYWLEEHNKFIDEGDGAYAYATPTFKELCKVRKAEVAEIVDKKRSIILINYDGFSRRVFSTLLPNVSKGDKVTVHLAYAIERI